MSKSFTVDLVVTCWFGAGGQGHFLATLDGLDAPNPEIAEALTDPGGQSQNTVEWNPGLDYYVVSGRYNIDKDFGDWPGNLCRRVRAVAGVSNVTFHVHHPDGTVTPNRTLAEVTAEELSAC